MDALVQADAGPDGERPVGLRLGHQLRVGHDRPGHGHGVGLARSQDALGRGGLRDPAGIDDGQGRGRLGLPTPRGPFAFLVAADRDVAGHSPVVADVQAEVVDRAFRGEGRHHRLALVQPVATLDQLVHAQPQAERDGPRDVLADRLDHLPQQAPTTIQVTAVAVGAAVGERREEPLEHVVVVGVQLDGVHACLRGQRGGLAVLADEPRHLVQVEGVGDAVVVVAADVVRCAERHAALQHHLRGEEASCGMDAPGELAEARDEVREAEQAGAEGTHAGGLEARWQRVAHKRWTAAHPLHTALHLREPERSSAARTGPQGRAATPAPPPCGGTTRRWSSEIVPTWSGRKIEGHAVEVTVAPGSCGRCAGDPIDAPASGRNLRLCR